MAIINRIIHRSLEELEATRKIIKLTSFKEGFNTFVAKIDMQMLNQNGGIESKNITKHLLQKHETMIKYFERLFGSYLDTYDYKNASRGGNLDIQIAYGYVGGKDLRMLLKL